MKKTYNFTEREQKIIDKAKIYFNEKTEVEAIKKMMEAFQRVNNLFIKEEIMKEVFKNGMYGEMPIVRIGDIQISQMSDREGETQIWFDISEVKGGGEGMQISPYHKNEKDGKTLEEDLIDVFNKHF